MVIHDLAQPLSAAALSIETAVLLLAQGQVEACRETMDAISQRLSKSNTLLRSLKIARGAEPSPWAHPFDPAALLTAVWPGLRLEPTLPLRGDRGFLEATLTGLSLAFRPDPSRVVVVHSPGASEVRIRLIGRSGAPQLAAFWTRNLGKSGIRALSRRCGEDLSITLIIPQHLDSDIQLAS